LGNTLPTQVIPDPRDPLFTVTPQGDGILKYEYRQGTNSSDRDRRYPNAIKYLKEQQGQGEPSTGEEPEQAIETPPATDCSRLYPTEYQPFGEGTDLLRNGDRTDVGQIARINPSLKNSLKYIVFNLNTPLSEVPDNCSGQGKRFLADENNQGVKALDFCKSGGKLSYKFVCQ
jgi:hypothetical protein